MQVSKAAILSSSVGICVVLLVVGYLLARESPGLGALGSVESAEEDWYRQTELRLEQLEGALSSLSIEVGSIAADQRLVSEGSSLAEGPPPPSNQYKHGSEESAEPGWMQALREKLGPDVPMRLDPGAVIDGAPDFHSPYTRDDLSRPEVVLELHDLFYLKRSVGEQIGALNILKESMIAGQQAEVFVFPEMLVIDALGLADRSSRDAPQVLKALCGLHSPVLKSKALLFVGDPDPAIRSDAVKVLEAFAGEDVGVQAILQQIAQSDPDHEVVSEALDALKGKE